MRRLALAVCLSLPLPLSAADRPIPAADAAKAMTLPPGFKATLFAGEPDVVQPISMAFDARGRLWVVECRSYPKWRDDGKGSDRVLIFEDTDNDGKHDKKTVFLDNMPNLSGIELGFGGVWLCSIPNLLFVPDRDGDDRPDGPPEVVLDGWSLKVRHNVVNSLGWGPDGWLYGCNGIIDTSWVGRPGAPKEDRKPMNCGVWRYHPTKKVFEPFAWGTTNPFGLDWDEYGELFMTNCVIDHLWHVVPGAHFTRMYGEDLNPYVYGLMGPCSDHKHWAGGHWTSSRTTGESGGKTEHSDAGGGHAHSGCMVYLGENFPKEYRNNVFMCNIHGNRLNRDKLEFSPAGYVGKHEKDFLFANDPWFRGLCVKQGPDGSIYVSDWTDTGECHNYEVADLTNGRIYKVVHGTPTPWKGGMAELSDEGAARLALSANEWVSRQARRALQERAAVRKLDDKAVGQLRSRTVGNTVPGELLRAAWALHVTGNEVEHTRTALLEHKDAGVRAWGVRLTAALAPTSADEFARLLGAAGKEASAVGRTALASAMQSLPDNRKLELAEVLFRNDADNADPNLTLMYWYGVQPAVLTLPEQALKLVPKIAVDRVRENVVRLALVRPGADQKAVLSQVFALIGSTPDEAARRDMLAGVQSALTGKRGLTLPPEWDKVSAELLGSLRPEVREAAEAVAVQFGDDIAIGMLVGRVRDPKPGADARHKALSLLVTHKAPGLAPTLHGLLSDVLLRGDAIRALAAYPDDKTPGLLLTLYPKLTAAEKADAVQTLASRPAFAAALLDAVEKAAVPRADVSVVAARQILSLNDRPVSERLGKVWGVIQPVPKDKATLFNKWKGLLKADAVKTADKAAGRAVFVKSCAACHKLFGEGGDAGPELTGSQRGNLDYLLENVLTPNAVVPREYQVTNFTTVDGRVVGGVVLKETADAVTVRTANDTVVLSKADIEARRETKQSLMPEALWDSLKPEEVRALVAYLGSPQQVPLPK